MPLATGHSSLDLFLASANPGKLREFQIAARLWGIDVKMLPGFLQLAPCTEDGATFEANARKKALHYAAFTDGLVFADDSGICVDALGGAPGVHSARFAGPAATDLANNQKLLAELRRIEAGRARAELNRAAHYVCFIALAQGDRIRTVVEGRVDGVIVDVPRGSGGFGYDPHFFYPPLGKTFAEITAEEKFAVSHRGEAFRKLLQYLGHR
ncbi:MAG: RdgB/HAM1 family non-canonical purine NTP pyrophosphatase [Terriglobia bacterium]